MINNAELSKLRLSENDILVVQTGMCLTQQQKEAILSQFHLLKNKVIILDGGFKLSILSPQEQ